jgi:peptide-methionine (S)-S-oxide reductase
VSEAVTAIQTGDIPALERLLDADPELLHRRLIGYGDHGDYFRDPKLLWFVADNPNLIETMPANSVELTRALLARRPDQADLDYTLELVMTSGPAREQGLQLPLMDVLIEAGAHAGPAAIEITLAHHELGAIEELLRRGYPMTAPIAASLGRLQALARLLPEDAQSAFTLAVVNNQKQAARLALDAGADVNARSHSTALHEAVLHDDVELLKLLIERGARTNVRDTIHDGTPLRWAQYLELPNAAAYLESLA